MHLRVSAGTVLANITSKWVGPHEQPVRVTRLPLPVSVMRTVLAEGVMEMPTGRKRPSAVIWWLGKNAQLRLRTLTPGPSPLRGEG